MIKIHSKKRSAQFIMFIFLLSCASNNLAKKVKIAFFLNILAVRGTQVATYDYADFNELILGNESIILNNLEFFNDPSCADFKADYNYSAREKFVNRFGNRFFDCANMQEAEEILKREKVDIFYTQKSGPIDDKVSKVCKNAIHAVFSVHPHGDAYAAISNWLSKKDGSTIPFVPYMVRVHSTQEDLRQELGIPRDAIVFGRHGGLYTFSIHYAKEAVVEMAQKHPNWYFVFLHTQRFCNLKNVIFLPLTADMEYKTKFINTCDAMIHARAEGETFGLAPAEFSMKNKPIITCLCGDLAHVEILGNKGFYYSNEQQLIAHITYIGDNIDTIRCGKWDCYSKEFSPEAVMKKFDEIFIQPLL